MAITSALLWLSLNIYYEARSESQQAQIAVAQVTMNRSINRQLPIKEVVLQPNQFSWTRDKHKRSGKIPKDKKAFITCLHSAMIAMSTPDITNGSTHFHEKGKKPRWVKSMHYTKSFGKHQYYKLKKSKRYKKTKAKIKQNSTSTRYNHILANNNLKNYNKIRK